MLHHLLPSRQPVRVTPSLALMTPTTGCCGPGPERILRSVVAVTAVWADAAPERARMPTNAAVAKACVLLISMSSSELRAPAYCKTHHSTGPFRRPAQPLERAFQQGNTRFRRYPGCRSDGWGSPSSASGSNPDLAGSKSFASGRQRLVETAPAIGADFTGDDFTPVRLQEMRAPGAAPAPIWKILVKCYRLGSRSGGPHLRLGDAG